MIPTGRKLKYRTGKVVGIYLPEEMIRKLKTRDNVSEYIRDLVDKSFSDSTYVQTELTLQLQKAIKQETDIKGELALITIRIEELRRKLSEIGGIQRNAELNRQNLIDQWKKTRFWPNLSWFESRIDILQLCQFNTPEQAMEWFNEHKL